MRSEIAVSAAASVSCFNLFYLSMANRQKSENTSWYWYSLNHYTSLARSLAKGARLTSNIIVDVKLILTFKALKYFCINHGYESLTHIMVLHDHNKYTNYFSAGIDFRRQNLTSKVDLRTERVK